MQSLEDVQLPELHTLGYVVLATLAFVLGRAALNIWLSPVAHVPGPRLAAATDYWGLWHQLHGNKYLRVHALYDKYGPVVRVGPNTVSLADPQYLPKVYQAKWSKTPAYDGFRTAGGLVNAFSAITQAEAQGKRRGMLPHYATANLVLWQDVFDHRFREILALLRGNGPEQPVDVLAMLAHALVDILGELVLDTKSSALADFAQSQHNSLTRSITFWPKRGTIKGQLHPLIWRVLSSLPRPALWRQVVDSDADLATYVGSHVSAARKSLGEEASLERPSLSHRLLTVTDSYQQRKWLEHEVTAEVMDHFIAGTETTSTTASYMFWTLSCRPEIMLRVQEEVDGLIGLDEVPDIQLLARQPYLNAVIKEALRLFSPAPGSFDRVVPADGIMCNGVFLPAGTAVGLQSYTLHRDPSVFPKADDFLPERWLNETPEMKTSHIPFMTGNRACPGQNLAMVDLRLALAIVLRNFDVKPAVDTTEQSMRPFDLTTVTPVSGEVKLHFIPRI